MNIYVYTYIYSECHGVILRPFFVPWIFAISKKMHGTKNLKKKNISYMYIFYFFVPWMFIHACGYEIFSHARACIRLHEFSHPCVIAMSVVCCSVCCSVCCRACCHTYAQRIYVHFC